MVSRELRKYVQESILPKYGAGDKGHGIMHVRSVIRRTLEIGGRIPGTDEDMLYAAAACHDLGYPIDPENHEEISARMVRNDPWLKAWFGPERLEIVARAVEDHRSSIGREPESVYGKAVATADKDADLRLAMARAYEYRRKRFPGMDLDAVIDDSRIMLAGRYGEGGTSKRSSYLPDPEFDAMCAEIARLAADPPAFRAAYIDAITEHCGYVPEPRKLPAAPDPESPEDPQIEP